MVVLLYLEKLGYWVPYTSVLMESGTNGYKDNVKNSFWGAGEFLRSNFLYILPSKQSK
jgi:hypothetical protein